LPREKCYREPRGIQKRFAKERALAIDRANHRSGGDESGHGNILDEAAGNGIT